MSRFAALFSVLVGLFVLWTGAWFAGAALIRARIEQAANGTPSVACTLLTIEGYPFRYAVACTDAVLTDGDVRIGIAELSASISINRPTVVGMTASSPATYTNAFSGAVIRLDWDSLAASVRLDWLSLDHAAVAIEGLVASDAVLDPFELARIGHAAFDAVGVDGAKTGSRRNLRLSAHIEEANLPQLEAPLFADITAYLTEWPAKVTDWGRNDLLSVWAAGGGEVNIDKAEIVTGALSAGLSGTLVPDSTGCIDGTLTLISRGFGPLMRHYLAAPLAGALLGPEDETGQSRQILVFSHSILRAGIVPLIELPPLF